MVSSSHFRGVRSIALPAMCACLALLGVTITSSASAALVKTGEWGGSWYGPGFQPSSLDFSDEGEMIVGDMGARRIARLGIDGEVKKAWRAGSGSTAPQYDEADPVGVAVDPDGNVYSADQLNDSIKKFAPDGTLLETWPLTPAEGWVYGVEYDDSGSVFVLRDTVVQRFTSEGVLEDTWGGFSSDHSDPVFTTDDDGHVLVAGTEYRTDTTSVRAVYKFDLDGARLNTWEFPADISREYLYVKCGSPVGAVTDVYGFVGIAAREGGGAWVVPDYDYYEEHPIQGISADGDINLRLGNGFRPRGPLEVGPDGHFWIASNSVHRSWDKEDLAVFAEYGADGTLLDKIDREDFPRYFDDDRGEGKFGGIEDIAVGPGGVVDTYDRNNARLQRFGATGDFEWMADGVRGVTVLGASVGFHDLIYGTGDGVKMFDSGHRILHRYSEDGTELAPVNMQVPGAGIYSGTGGPNDETFVVSGLPLRISHLSATGQELKTWMTPGLPEPYGVGDRAIIRRTPAGNLLVQSDQVMQEYTAGGTLVRQWNISGNPADFGVDGLGIIYVLSYGEGPSTVKTYLPNGQPLSAAEPVGPQVEYQTASQMAVTPDGGVYVANRDHVFRYEQGADGDSSPHASGSRSALPATGTDTAKTEEIECGPCDCYEDPDPRPRNRFLITSVSYSKKKNSARLGLYLPFAGKVVLYGDRKVRRRSFTVHRSGRFSIKVEAKAKWRGPVSRKKQARVPLTARLRYIPVQGRRIQTASRKLILKRKFVKKPK